MFFSYQYNQQKIVTHLYPSSKVDCLLSQHFQLVGSLTLIGEM